jgi:ribosomal protein S12 methylthiotransferase
MERFVSQNLDVLIEEQIDSTAGADNENGENFWLGRLYCQAPEIDGAAVIVKSETGKSNPQPGTFVKCKVISRRGFDLEVRI